MRALIKKSFWMTVVLFSLALLSYFFWDQSLSLYYNQDDFYRFRRFSRYATDLGDAEPYFLFSLFSYCFFRWVAPRLRFFSKDLRSTEKFRSWFFFVFISLLSLGLFTQILKIIVGRQRPHRSPSFENFHFVPFNLHWHWHSFPSGHSELLFVLATSLAFLKPNWRYVFFAVAFFLALTRVFTHNHFLSDVLVGSWIGYLGVQWLKFYFDQKQLTRF